MPHPEVVGLLVLEVIEAAPVPEPRTGPTKTCELVKSVNYHLTLCTVVPINLPNAFESFLKARPRTYSFENIWCQGYFIVIFRRRPNRAFFKLSHAQKQCEKLLATHSW